MDRRKFLNWVGLGALATSLPVAIAACQSESSSPADTASDSPESSAASSEVGTVRPDGSFVVGTVADLDENGVLKGRPAFSSGAVLVIRAPDAADTLYVVDSLCTHQGCSVDWESSASEFACPCHGSTFSADGSVTTGPATDPLATFQATIDGELVLVQPS
ncbi:MAG: Rieske (2Fe-2S) protein [Cyanobacteria bacterium P01_E01_bin.6]